MKDGSQPIDPKTKSRAVKTGKTVIFPGIDVVTTRIHGRDLCFATTRERDPIQRKHRKGKFYEAHELNQIKAHFPFGGTFVDIGANVGNHSLYVAAFLNPGVIIPFEPNPEAYKLLLANVAMNGVADRFDLSNLGLGVSSGRDGGFGVSGAERNLGGGKLTAGTGDIATVSGDEALAGRTVDMIKIDVEGMEMAVLEGLRETLARCRPVLLIEIMNRQAEAFDNWRQENAYDVAEEVQRYAGNRNFLLIPRKAAADAVVAG